MNNGDRPGAMAAFRRELKTNPNDFQANLRLGLLLRDEDRLDEARDYLQRAARLRPKDPDVLYGFARIQLGKDELAAAQKTLEELTASAPEFEGGHVLLATVYYRPDGGRTATASGRSSRSSRRRARPRGTRATPRRRRSLEHAPVARSTLPFSPARHAARPRGPRTGRAAARRRQARPEAGPGSWAAPAPPRRSTASPGGPRPPTSAQKLDEAQDLYQKALKLRPGWSEGRFALGTILYDLDRYAEARSEFRQVTASSPRTAPSRSSPCATSSSRSMSRRSPS